jgi:hypothetical protein
MRRASTWDNYLLRELSRYCHENTLENLKSSSNALITFLGTKVKYAW